jgi:hypothetical protein
MTRSKGNCDFARNGGKEDVGVDWDWGSERRGARENKTGKTTRRTRVAANARATKRMVERDAIKIMQQRAPKKTKNVALSDGPGRSFPSLERAVGLRTAVYIYTPLRNAQLRFVFCASSVPVSTVDAESGQLSAGSKVEWWWCVAAWAVRD